MEAVGPSLPSFAISSLSRVTSASLDPPQKKGMCSKEKYVESVQRISPKMRYSEYFQGKIGSVPTRELQPAKSAYAPLEFNRMPASVHVASTFGFIAGLLRQKGIPPDGLANSPRFTAVISLLNSVILDLDPDRAQYFPFGAKTHESTEEFTSLLAKRTAYQVP